MASFYGSLKHNYQPIREDEDIDTIPFLEASSDSIIGFLDILGSTAFAPVKSDVIGNIKKLNAKYETNKEKFVTLGAILDEEKESGTTYSKNSATDALMWLSRGLSLVSNFIKNVLNTTPADKNVEGCMVKAYEDSLKKFHGWIVQGVASLAFKALPYREALIASLSNGVSEDQLIEELKSYQQILELHIHTIEKLYIDRNLNIDQGKAE